MSDHIAPSISKTSTDTTVCDKIAAAVGAGLSPAALEKTLIKAIHDIWNRDNRPPALSEVIWYLSAQVSDSAVDGARLQQMLAAFHQINLYTFQSLQSDDLGFTGLLEDDSTAAETLPKEIFLVWSANRDRDPTKTAAEFLMTRIGRTGHAQKDLIDRTDLSRIDAIVSQSLAEDKSSFYEIYQDETGSARDAMNKPPRATPFCQISMLRGILNRHQAHRPPFPARLYLPFSP